ncbi:MAG TPA: acyl-CoA dehydrogenase family protein [Myxococcota bacterium]|nr:acyl-CoA dehydrogenase family protein [Myxococcota bacterium]
MSGAERMRDVALEIAPRIRARAPEIEAGRRLPLDLVQELKAAGFFRMGVPRSHGGLETPYPETVEALCALSAADGATGWTVMIGSESPQLLALLPRESFDRIYAAGPDVIIAGAFAPQGRATPVAGGYRVSGRWSFASGCQHADWLFGHCALEGGGAQPPALRCMLARAGDWTIHDTWRTAGLRGTGSQDIEVSELFVPHDHSFVLFGGVPTLSGAIFQAPLLQASLHIAAVALGIGEGAHAELVEFAGTKKKRLYASTSLPDSPLFQYRVGHAQAELFAARALLTQRAQELWAFATAGDVPFAFSLLVLQASAWIAETAARVVDTCYTAAGGSALYESSPLQRRLRDAHTLTQHASLQETVFTNAGAALFGASGGFGL